MVVRSRGSKKNKFRRLPYRARIKEWRTLAFSIRGHPCRIDCGVVEEVSYAGHKYFVFEWALFPFFCGLWQLKAYPTSKKVACLVPRLLQIREYVSIISITNVFGLGGFRTLGSETSGLVFRASGPGALVGSTKLKDKTYLQP